ncbi:Hypothetical predicted protein [Octopus vulgaris]|uniref:Uncharacterized protein n=1 Tax=Octopus vulgaris TaxID=6645 RepID=A0AA36BNH4_OCTVU|nr:Hypothetical predicted protein [Octopus vulgaris]
MDSRRGSFDVSGDGADVGDSGSMVDDCDRSGVENNGIKDAENEKCCWQQRVEFDFVPSCRQGFPSKRRYYY